MSTQSLRNISTKVIGLSCVSWMISESCGFGNGTSSLSSHQFGMCFVDQQMASCWYMINKVGVSRDLSSL